MLKMGTIPGRFPIPIRKYLSSHAFLRCGREINGAADVVNKGTNQVRLLRRILWFRLRIHFRLHFSRGKSSRLIPIRPVERVIAGPSSAEADLLAILPGNDGPSAVDPMRRSRPGLPPAVLLVLVPLRKRLTSREFWLGAIVVVWTIAAFTIQ
jgi:hypothetical protein